jgi:hypothetical protein
MKLKFSLCFFSPHHHAKGKDDLNNHEPLIESLLMREAKTVCSFNFYNIRKQFAGFHLQLF